ncbi:hypothetical protein ACIGXM_15185 [Kitasatospora sp. NPDC052896]|uniref:hypothetical protein n=1 Tax=Kitasatospora sp. NPDC052896 TaxID=3364061 RepID=UPI0037CAFDF8
MPNRLPFRIPLSRPAAAGYGIEALAAAGFVTVVYETVVGGVVRLWPQASDNLVLLLWIAAATICGVGMKAVRTRARALLARRWPAVATEPYTALVSFVADAAATGSVEDALPRLVRLVADGAGARTVELWLTGERGLHLAADLRHRPTRPVATVDDLSSRPGVRHVLPVTDTGELLGALALGGADGGELGRRDLRLATDIANAAGLLLRNVELEARLRERIRLESEQAEELRTSRRRLVVARDTAREQLGREIRAVVCEPLERCALELGSLRERVDPPEAEDGPDVAELARRVDTVIGQFRRLVHGVYPSVLTDHGLLPALADLVADQERRAVLDAGELPGLPARIEAGGYFCTAALLRAWPHSRDDEPITVTAKVVDRELTVTISDSVPRTGADLPDAVVVESALDRLAALGGRLEQRAGPAGLSVVITLPRTAEAAREEAVR